MWNLRQPWLKRPTTWAREYGNCLLWTMAERSTYQSTGGAVADEDGEVVGEWQDYAGTSSHLTETTEEKKVLLKTNVFGVHPTLRGDGTNDRLQFDGLDLVDDYTLHIALRCASGNSGCIVDLARVSNEGCQVKMDADGYLYLHAHTTPAYLGDATVFLADGQPHLLTLSRSGAGETQMTLDGTALDGCTATDTYTRIFLWNTATESDAWGGDLMEMVLFARYFSPVDLQLWQAYHRFRVAV